MKFQCLKTSVLLLLVSQLAMAAGGMSGLAILSEALDSPAGVQAIAEMVNHPITGEPLAAILAGKLSDREIRAALRSPEGARAALAKALVVARSDAAFRAELSTFMNEHLHFDAITAQLKAEAKLIGPIPAPPTSPSAAKWSVTIPGRGASAALVRMETEALFDRWLPTIVDSTLKKFAQRLRAKMVDLLGDPRVNQQALLAGDVEFDETAISFELTNRPFSLLRIGSDWFYLEAGGYALSGHPYRARAMNYNVQGLNSWGRMEDAFANRDTFYIDLEESPYDSVLVLRKASPTSPIEESLVRDARASSFVAPFKTIADQMLESTPISDAPIWKSMMSRPELVGNEAVYARLFLLYPDTREFVMKGNFMAWKMESPAGGRNSPIVVRLGDGRVFYLAARPNGLGGADITAEPLNKANTGAGSRDTEKLVELSRGNQLKITYDASGAATEAQFVFGGRMANMLAEEAYRRNPQLAQLFGSASEEGLALALRRGWILPEDLYPENIQTASLTSSKSGNQVRALKTTASLEFGYLRFLDVDVDPATCKGFWSTVSAVGHVLSVGIRTIVADGTELFVDGEQGITRAAVVKLVPVCGVSGQ